MHKEFRGGFGQTCHVDVTLLSEVVGSSYVRSATDEYLVDPLGRRGGGAKWVVVQPADTAEVAEVLTRSAEVPVVVQAGNTGLVSGQIPPPTGPVGIVLSLRRLQQVEDVDAQCATLGCGVTLATVQQLARAQGAYYGVDLASRDSATIGGTFATNAGGMRVCAYGSTRNQVVGFEAVKADGSVISDLRGLAKDNTGYDLTSLLCGSEGTLAVVTRLRVAWQPAPRRATLIALATPTLAEAYNIARDAVEPGFPLLAAEVVDTASWADAAKEFGLPNPLGPAATAPYILLLEVGDDASGAGFRSTVQQRNPVVALEPGQRRALWQLRESQSQLWGRRPNVKKFDVGFPPESLDSAVAKIRTQFDGVARLGIFGHIHEANLHLQILDADVARVLGIVAESGGSISAEHGIGRDKAALLGLRRSQVEIDTMWSVKRAFDPHGRLNPGVLLPEQASEDHGR